MSAAKPKRFDTNLIVIGAGSAGLISALIAATVRAKVTLIERSRMGGDCLNTGCVPSKTLIRSAKIAHYLADAQRYGLRDVSGSVDFPAVMQRVRDAIATIAPNDSIERYTSLGVDCVTGSARIVDPWTVEVDGKRITARNIVIASGAMPFIPPIPGVGDVGALTSDDVWSLESLPKRLVVMGAGPIGCELAQSFQRLGSSVTLIDMADRVLPKEDADVSALVAEVLRGEGIDVLTSHKAVRFEVGGQKRLVAENAGRLGGDPLRRSDRCGRTARPHGVVGSRGAGYRPEPRRHRRGRRISAHAACRTSSRVVMSRGRISSRTWRRTRPGMRPSTHCLDGSENSR